MPELDLERLFAEMGQREKADKLERYRRLNALAKPGQILLAGSSLMEQFPIHELLQDAGVSLPVYNRGVGASSPRNFRPPWTCACSSCGPATSSSTLAPTT